MADYQLTDEQANKFNQAMSGQDAELTDEQASMFNQMMTQKNQTATSNPPQQTNQTQTNPIANPQDLDVTGSKFQNAVVNRASMGAVPLVADAASAIKKDPVEAAKRAVTPTPGIGNAIVQSVIPAARIQGIAEQIAGPEKANRDLYNQSSSDVQSAGQLGNAPFSPASIAGQIANPANAIGAGQASPQRLAGIDQFISEKFGPKALNWINEFAERIATRGSKADIAAMRKTGQLQRIKVQLVNKLKPGLLDTATQLSQRLSQQSAPPEMVRPPNPRTGTGATFQKSAGALLEQTMAPGIEQQIKKFPNAGLAQTLPGAVANSVIDKVARVRDIGGLKTAQTIAQKAIQIMNRSLPSAQRMSVESAPFERQQVLKKLQTIKSMDPRSAAAYGYAESMMNPVFRQVWMEAQNDEQE